jgi:cytochrome c oxidase cbb3-type subunit 3
MNARAIIAGCALAVSTTQAADQPQPGQAPAPAPQSQAGTSAPQQAFARIPLGDVAGAAPNANVQMDNPLAGQQQAVEQGKNLFRAMNCAYCHGLRASGVMAPNLTDTYWRYGGTPAMIYKSIAEGRPQGMPSWGRMLPPDAIWSIVAYIQSLGGTYPANQYDKAMQGDLAKGDTKPGAGLIPEEQGSW